MDILGIPTVLVPPNPGNVSAFGLLTVDVKNDYVQTHVALQDRLDAAEAEQRLRGAGDTGRGGADQGGLREADHVFAAYGGPALLRAGLRGPGPGAGG